ncbi:MAG: HPP family protein [Helicobacteraceae bacterium]|jgi:CBS-domain-containing membrane protein|nr:HPP family protein [Helicobacteraceae bacterium]
MKHRLFVYFKRMKGGRQHHPKRPFSKVLWSWLGAFIGIYTIAIVNDLVNTDHTDALFLLGSFGASSVLIYAAPQAEFSQPRNFLGGHILSTIIGITIYKFLPFDIPTLSAIAVSLSIVVMYLTNTLHPPGGATALVAIVGSPQTHQLGYWFVLSPVLLDSVILLIIGLVINNMSANPKRHYPRYWF